MHYSIKQDYSAIWQVQKVCHKESKTTGYLSRVIIQF